MPAPALRAAVLLEVTLQSYAWVGENLGYHGVETCIPGYDVDCPEHLKRPAVIPQVQPSPTDYPGPTEAPPTGIKNCTTQIPVECVFPFTYKGLSYSTCTGVDAVNTMWCSTTSKYDGHWKQCSSNCQQGQWPAKKIASTVVAGAVATTGIGLIAAAIAKGEKSGNYNPFAETSTGIAPVGHEGRHHVAEAAPEQHPTYVPFLISAGPGHVTESWGEYVPHGQAPSVDAEIASGHPPAVGAAAQAAADAHVAAGTFATAPEIAMVNAQIAAGNPPGTPADSSTPTGNTGNSYVNAQIAAGNAPATPARLLGAAAPRQMNAIENMMNGFLSSRGSVSTSIVPVEVDIPVGVQVKSREAPMGRWWADGPGQQGATVHLWVLLAGIGICVCCVGFVLSMAAAYLGGFGQKKRRNRGNLIAADPGFPQAYNQQ